MQAVILNAGDASWVFEEHAQNLAGVFHVPISSTPTEYNYLLGWQGAEPPSGKSFIPYASIQLASDKRLLAQVFANHQIATPQTHLLDSEAEVKQLIQGSGSKQWVLKWPTGCGASGHRLQDLNAPIPQDWPRPYVLQEFIRLEVPEVYRLYCVAGETFGWNARRFPAGAKTSPFVAHAQGARYEAESSLPEEAESQARQALSATNLLSSFGCADLMRDANANWLVLEVNTDGVFNHVDRDINVGNIAREIDERLAATFKAWCAQPI
jgi:glutathione synthase/RimK-type ligase-like ATP-grasp enzyme